MTDTHSSELHSSTAPYHHGDLKEALVAAAIALLAEEQDWSFSLREVARRAGVSHNAPYNHFRTKQDLLVAVAAAGYNLLRVRMQEATALVATPAAALRAVGVAYVHFGLENPAHYRLMFGTALVTAKNCLPPALEESATTAKELLRDIIGQGSKEGSFTAAPGDAQALNFTVLSAWSLVHGLTMLLIDGLADAEVGGKQPVSADAVAQQVAQILLDGVSK